MYVNQVFEEKQNGEKKIRILLFLLIALSLLACQNETSESKESAFVSSFRPDVFVSDTLSKYLSNEKVTNLTFDATTSPVARATGDETLSVVANFTGYEYDGKYTVDGKLNYTLPVANGEIQGYSVSSDQNDVPKIKEGEAENEIPFAVSMSEDELLPAYGTVTSDGSSVSVEGEAFPPLPGNNVSFQIGDETFTPDDLVVEEPYTKNMIAEDLYSMTLAQGPLSKLIMNNATPDESGNISYTLPGKGNTFSQTGGNSGKFTATTNLEIKSPTHFTTQIGDATYSVNTSGTVSLNTSVYVDMDAQSSQIISYSGEYNDFIASIIITENGKSTYLQSKPLNGTFGMTSQEIGIGSHTYKGSEVYDLSALNVASNFNLYISEVDEAGDVNLNYPQYQLTGKLTSGNFKGSLTIMNNHYPFDISFDESTDEITRMTFDGITFDEEAIKYLNANAKIYADLM